MSQYHTINAGELERGFTVIARLDGSPITAGTVNYYLKCKSGTNAGKWWRDSDQSWQATETANAMTHDVDGHWDVLLNAGAAGPFVAGVRYREYVKESGNLHVPEGRLLACDAAPGTPGGPLLVGTGDGAVNPSGGKVPATITAGDNSDKTGYSLADASGSVGPTAGIADDDITPPPSRMAPPGSAPASTRTGPTSTRPTFRLSSTASFCWTIKTRTRERLSTAMAQCRWPRPT